MSRIKKLYFSFAQPESLVVVGAEEILIYELAHIGNEKISLNFAGHNNTKKVATAPSECPTNHFSLPIVDRPLLCCCIKTKMHIAHTASFERLFSSFTSPSHSSPLFSVVFFAKQVTVVCQLIYVLFTMK